MLLAKNLCFFLLVLKQVNALITVIIVITHKQNCVFLMLLKNLNVRAFNLMSKTNETRHLECHEIRKCKCGLDASYCNNSQKWKGDKCRCECKELIDKSVCEKGFICNSSKCECEPDKSCNVGEYLDYESCKCRKKIS